ncbi:MAG: type II secretion system F family protein [Candidatus Ratteibacteria bacterium]|nr:type II secretion system F family protein [Candidatus Ratteibacteria bacterium]
MPLYRYTVIDESGHRFENQREAENEEVLTKTLRSKGYIVVSCRPAGKGISLPFGDKKEKGKTSGGLLRGKTRVKLDSLVMFTRQLATMVNAGLPLVQALFILQKQVEDKTLAGVIARVKEDVERGLSLSEALANHPRVFSVFFVSMVQAGEVSGMLDVIMNEVANYLESMSATRRKVRMALVYPAVVTFMAILVTLVFLLKVVPVFKTIFVGLEAMLPRPTQVLIALSEFMQHNFLYAVIGLVLAIIIAIRIIHTEKGRLKFDTLKLHLPVFGILLEKLAMARFSGTLSTLIKGGVPILLALEIVARTAGNKVVEKDIEYARLSIREGESIAVPLRESKVFPPMVVEMIAVGEETGALESMLAKVAEFYNSQVEDAISGLTSLIEPILIAFLGLVVGSMAIAMFLPIFKMVQLVG